MAIETKRTSKIISDLQSLTGASSPYLSDLLYEKYGSTRRSEILASLGDDGRTFEEQLYDDLGIQTSPTYTRKITIDADKVGGSENLSDFTILFSGTYAYLKTTGNGGSVVSDNGDDIYFTSDSSASTLLPHEIEAYDPTTGQIIAWVKVPTVGYNTDTDIYLHYGNTSNTMNHAVQRNAWDDDALVVFHLNEDGNTTAGGYTDSIGTTSGTGVSLSASSDVAGKIGTCHDFVSSDPDRIEFDDAIGEITNMTLSIWVNPDAQTDEMNAFTADTGGFSNDFLFGVSPETTTFTTTKRMAVSWQKNSDSSRTHVEDTADITAGSWTHYHITYDGTTMTMYRNGVSVDTAAKTGLSIANTDKWALGINRNANVRPWNGKLDEARIFTAAKTAGWCLTDYNTQNDPSTFYSVGSETTTNIPVPTRIVLMNDIHYGQTSTDYATRLPSQVTNISNNYTPVAVFTAGDDFHGDTISDFDADVTSFVSAMDNLPCSWYFCYGNHDHFDKSSLDTQLDADGVSHTFPVKTTISTNGGYAVDIITIDTGSGGTNGSVGVGTLSWLASNLGTNPTFIIFHHPTNSPNYQVTDETNFFSTIDTYGNVKAVFFGHDHNNLLQTTRGGYTIKEYGLRRAGGSWGVDNGFSVIEIDNVAARFYTVRDDGERTFEASTIYLHADR